MEEWNEEERKLRQRGIGGDFMIPQWEEEVAYIPVCLFYEVIMPILVGDGVAERLFHEDRLTKTVLARVRRRAMRFKKMFSTALFAAAYVTWKLRHDARRLN
jgi:hypothetical protein